MVINISVLKIDVGAIKNNLKRVRSNLLPNQKLCVVAKANCYGLGNRVVKFISDDADYFAVSSGEEYFEVRKYTTKPILILCPIYSGLERLISSGAELTVSNFESLQKVIRASEKSGIKAKVHLAVNTGMNRFGFKGKEEFVRAIRIIKKTQNVSILGVFSHYFEANNKKFDILQYNLLKEYEQIFYENYDKKVLFHLPSSYGIFSQNGFDMARCGMAVYDDSFFATISLQSKIVDIQHLKCGESAGYDRAFEAKEDTTIAVVAIGYGDGIFRKIKDGGKCLIGGKFAKIVAVCMDTILVDITNSDAKIGDKVVLIGKSEKKQIFVCDVAKVCDTISYEIMVRISDRVKRRYIKG